MLWISWNALHPPSQVCQNHRLQQVCRVHVLIKELSVRQALETQQLAGMLHEQVGNIVCIPCNYIINILCTTGTWGIYNFKMVQVLLLSYS